MRDALFRAAQESVQLALEFLAHAGITELPATIATGYLEGFHIGLQLALRHPEQARAYLSMLDTEALNGGFRDLDAHRVGVFVDAVDEPRERVN